MDETSRRLLASLARAVVCGAAGPLLGGLAFVVTAAALLPGGGVEEGASLVETTGEVLVGLTVASLVAFPVGVLVGVAATVAAFVLTRCPSPLLGSLVAVVATGLWSRVAPGLAEEPLARLALLGLAPTVVRLAFATLGEARVADPSA